MNKQIEEAVAQLVDDIRYVFPESSIETAAKSAAVFIRNPQMLVELKRMVNDKLYKEKESQQTKQ